ncbi:abc transporter family protein [Stylonychia lemnae]|uniref:Abc transporter family protein n=1 Tax=Stylonychia lemnae TaxID=5949 RepID=A0A077ZWV4_STYLE|nr:abc transporter family protein [Stylonychia lemnae]|eukprot:CDW72976.1 abc transporter family protein [Stylonychia lemnae]
MIDIYEDLETAITSAPPSPEKERRFFEKISNFQFDLEKLQEIQSSSEYERSSQSSIQSSSNFSDILQDKNAIKLEFKNLSYILKTKDNSNQIKGGKQILKGISGFAIPGETCFIMGASGSGKTTLLNILSQRTKCMNMGDITGKIKVNDDLEMNAEMFAKYGAYVMQDDLLFQFFTPREALLFAARMRLKLSIKEQEARVDSLIGDLGLVNAQNTLIGNALQKTLSGGERKRTAIGVEIITDPSLIILDEPTSGLDSFRSVQIIKLLNKLARKGKTVISSIHSPNSEGFMLFDKLIILSDGHIIFQGQAKLAHEYFCQIGFQCPTFQNPADYYMKTFSQSYPLNDLDQRKIDLLKQSYEIKISEAIALECEELKLLKPQFQNIQENTSFRIQLINLISRNKSQALRDPKHYRARLIQAIYTALLIVMLYHKITASDNQNNHMDLVGAIYYSCQNTVLQNLLASVMMFYPERRIFLKESSQNLYSIYAYYLSKLTLEIPFLILQACITSIVIYFGLGLELAFYKFFGFFFSLSCLILTAASYGQLIGCIFTRPETASQVAPLMIIPLNIAGGFYTNLSNLPKWVQWLQYISPIRYGLESILQLQFDDVDQDELNPLDQLDFDFGYKTCVLALISLMIIYRILSLVILKRFVKNNI